MSARVLRSELEGEIRKRAELEGDDYVTQSELRGYIRESMNELYDMLVNARGQEYFTKSYYFLTSDIVSPTGRAVLHQRFYQALGVYVADRHVWTGEVLEVGSSLPHPAQARWVRMRAFMRAELADLMNLGFVTDPALLRYRFTGTQADSELDPDGPQDEIEILPFVQPGTVYTIRVDYIPVVEHYVSPTGYGSTNDIAYEGVNGWEDWAIWRCVAICWAKEQRNTDEARKEMLRLEARIKALAPKRDAGEPERIVDVVGRRRPRGRSRWEM